MDDDGVISPWLVDGALERNPSTIVAMTAAVGAQLATRRDTPSALEAVPAAACRLVPGARWASVTHGRAEGFETLAASDPVASGADHLQYQLGTGPCVDAVINDSVFASADLALDPRWSYFGPQVARDLGIRSVLSLRLTLDGADADPNAALNLYGDHRDAFDDTSRFVACVLAVHAALAVSSLLDRHSIEHVRAVLYAGREVASTIGVVARRYQVTREQAFGLLQLAGQHSHRPLGEIAVDILRGGVLPLPVPPHRA